MEESCSDLNRRRPRMPRVPRLEVSDRKERAGGAAEIITLAGLLSEGNTCHPTSLYFYGNDSVLVNDFAEAVGSFPDTRARITFRRGRTHASRSA